MKGSLYVLSSFPEKAGVKGSLSGMCNLPEKARVYGSISEKAPGVKVFFYIFLVQQECRVLYMS